ncbi:hypothetical protein H8K32_14215 [Undibacterium jejuense]|uniref:Uncharacterized protein n=1 Tax=Undibacterium jejuense TaxID=1344949 RepID=A0A923HRA3_9BURK|nr:hypothetical protein [Undibacterium jejuense]MBC3863258.1 hypothetical protein [Undibacterium jejuense]
MLSKRLLSASKVLGTIIFLVLLSTQSKYLLDRTTSHGTPLFSKVEQACLGWGRDTFRSFAQSIALSVNQPATPIAKAHLPSVDSDLGSTNFLSNANGVFSSHTIDRFFRYLATVFLSHFQVEQHTVFDADRIISIQRNSTCNTSSAQIDQLRAVTLKATDDLKKSYTHTICIKSKNAKLPICGAIIS